MNSYNEDLQSEVSYILQNQQRETENLTSISNAQLLTLYYASGAVISTASVLQAQKEKQAFAALIMKQTTESNAICNNLMISAAQSAQYLKQSTSNTALAAANIQIAATAVVKLAGDISSIYNVIEAADFDTEIQQQALLLNTCIEQTASAAETASQLALEASVLTSEVSADTLLKKAKSVNTGMNDLMRIVGGDYDKIAAEVLTAEAGFLEAIMSRKNAEGSFADSSAKLKALSEAYSTINTELNLDLKAGFTLEQQTALEISFNLVKSPFVQKDTTAFYPVKDYYIFLVKEKNKSVFSNENAESMLHRFPDQYIHVDQLNPEKTQVYKVYNYLQIPGAEKTMYALKDSDGEEIFPGVNYVAFLLVVYQEAYKKQLNNYSDLLSAPSQAFYLTHPLATAQSIKTDVTNKGWPKNIMFSVEETPGTKGQVEYRCILLHQSEKHQGNEIDFLFNLPLALQVSAASYTISGKSVGESNSRSFSLPVSSTDNFGNELETGKYYIPVILSVFAGKAENAISFTNTWTGYKETPLLYIN